WLAALRHREAVRAPAPTASPEVHRSLAFAMLLDGLRADHKLQVLDLGPAVGGNVEFLSRFDCKLFIEDLYAALAGRVPGEDGRPQGIEELLPLPDSARFDMVLAWDLFNYLERDEVRRLVRHLARYCRPGAVLLALVSIHKQMPAQPMRFRIVDGQSLVYEQRSAHTRPAPRYASSDLSGMFEGFRVDRSFLLRHGIQEYLFVREDDDETWVAEPGWTAMSETAGVAG
ncbi:MAG TPA: class I SAM-dependent methyltransferase, partial [Thermoanaerobaculia bacterium]|nr:class I SAM-dependent methyltransferase [Thermoanaerobaculia bacterium]